jgi:hypothetical protein
MFWCQNSDASEGRKAQVDFLNTFILIDSKPHEQTPGDSQPHAPSSRVLDCQQKKEPKALLQNMDIVHPHRSQVTNMPNSSEEDADASERDLLLPVLLSQYKKKDDTIEKSMNRMRISLVSALRFLAALSITEQPVFGLVVNGRLGAVIMAWQKSEACTLSVHTVSESSQGIQKIYIMERNIRHYDISDPLQAFQFVSVLLRLTRHGLKLRAAFDEKKDALFESLRVSKYTSWSKLAQKDAQGGGSEAPQHEHF